MPRYPALDRTWRRHPFVGWPNLHCLRSPATSLLPRHRQLVTEPIISHPRAPTAALRSPAAASCWPQRWGLVIYPPIGNNHSMTPTIWCRYYLFIVLSIEFHIWSRRHCRTCPLNYPHLIRRCRNSTRTLRIADRPKSPTPIRWNSRHLRIADSPRSPTPIRWKIRDLRIADSPRSPTPIHCSSWHLRIADRPRSNPIRWNSRGLRITWPNLLTYPWRWSRNPPLTPRLTTTLTKHDLFYLLIG